MSSASIPTDLRGLMSMPVDSVERPPALPVGHYFGAIMQPEFGKSSQKKTDFVRFPIRVDRADEDVNPSDLAGLDLSRIELRSDYYITPKAMFMLRDVLEAVLGPQPGRTFDEMVPEMRGAKVYIGVIQNPSQDGKQVFNEVTTIVAA